MSKNNFENSKINKSIIGDGNKNITTVEKGQWFVSGFIVPLVIAFITEIFKQGLVSDILNYAINKFN